MNLKTLLSSAFLLATTSLFAQLPLMDHIYAADPSARIWPNDPNTLWLYTSHDIPGTNHHATMHGYHVFSTTDLVNWIDHGRVLSIDDVDWAISHAWAIDAVYRHGKYYLVTCMIEAKTGMFRTGLATSDVPQGPFTDIGFIQGVEWGQDPALFIDDDNTPYLYWGSGGRCHAVQLSDDLLSAVPGTKVELTKQLHEVFEGPWVHKYKGKYYLSYPALAGNKWPQQIYYAVADKPLGPYTYKGNIIPYFDGQAGTNHGSIIEFKNKWIAFHHAAIVSGGMSEVRNLMADFLHYNPDGTINPIKPDNQSITGGKKANVKMLLEAENGKAAGGKMMHTIVESVTPGYSGKGYVTGFDGKHDNVSVLAQVSKDMKARLFIRLSAEGDFNADVLVGAKMLAGWDGLPLKKTNGWEIIDLGLVDLKEGNNMIRINCKNDVKLKVDYFMLQF
jgi:hypothetical protein